MKVFFISIILLIPLFLISQPTFISGEDPKPSGKSWVPVAELSDEFSGRSIDQEKWQVEPVGNDFTWIGRPPGLFQAKNIKQKGGKLRVEVGVLDEPQVIEGDTFLYYGGIVRSWNPGQHGWYYEARIKSKNKNWTSWNV